MKIGTHFCIADHEFGTLGESPNTGTPFVDVTLTLEGGQCDGETITWRGFLSEKAAPHTVRSLVRAFGWNGDPANLLCGNGYDGRCSVQVGTKTLENGKQIFQAEFINPAGPSLDEGRRKSLADELRERCITAAKETEATKPAKSLPGIQEDSGSIPF